MPDKDRYDFLINAILGKAMRIKLDMFESNNVYYVLTTQNYQDLQEIKRLATELEEMDSLSENLPNNQ